jgi:DNA-binding transcriptional ArsR family regulator
MGDDDRLWTAIAEPSRRRLLDALLERGDATATELAHGLPITRQAVTKHLAVLEEVGLIEGRRQGREVRYTVLVARVDAAAAAMGRVAGMWDARLARIKRIAETVHAAQLAASEEPHG